MRGVRLGCVATRIAGIVGGTTRIRAVLISLATLSSSEQYLAEICARARPTDGRAPCYGLVDVRRQRLLSVIAEYTMVRSSRRTG